MRELNDFYSNSNNGQIKEFSEQDNDRFDKSDRSNEADPEAKEFPKIMIQVGRISKKAKIMDQVQ